MNRIETERMDLRPLELGDAQSVMRIFSDPAAMAYAPISVTNDVSVASGFIQWQHQNYEEHGIGVGAVILKSNADYVGHAGLIPQAIGVEVFYSLIPSYWGQGLATEIAMACRDYALNKVGLKRLIAVIHPMNQRAIRVAAKIGMQPKETVRIFGRDDMLYEYQRAE